MFRGVVLIVLIPLAARAQPPERLPLAAVVAEALATNPEIAAARSRYEAARQRPAQERSLPDPMMSAGYNAVGNPTIGAGVGTEPTANVGFMVTQEIPYPGKLDLRASIAVREAEAELRQIEAAQLSVTARAKQAYYRLAYTYAVGDVLARNRDLLNTLVKVSENRYAVGQAAQQDVIKAQTQMSVLELQMERVQRERAVRQGELNALLARASNAPLAQPDDLRLTAFESSLEELIARARERAPMLRRDEILIDRSELGLDAARREYKPDFALSGGYYSMGAMPPMYEFRLDVKIPLRRERRAAAVAEQLSLVEQARRTYDATRLGLQGRIQEDFQMASTAARLARLYRDNVLPQARLALESSMASYQTGRVDFLSVVTNFGTVLEYEMTYFDELTTYHTAVSRLEEMTGSPMVH